MNRTIASSDELDALPAGSVVLDSEGVAAQLDDMGSWWSGQSWAPFSVTLPATVLHEPAQTA